MLFCLCVFASLVSKIQACDIQKTKLYYIYDSESDSLTGVYQEKTYDVESGIVTDKSWNTTITGPILNDSTSFNCPTGWTQYSRTGYNYCFYIVYQIGVGQSEAQNYCKQLNASLAGFQTKEEWTGTFNLIQPTYSSTGYAYMWIGASRVSSSCVSESSVSYNWTDDLTTGTNGMLWVGGQPDCSGPCVGMFFSNKHIGDSGKLDDVICEATTADFAKCFDGYICGKPATFS